MDAVTGPLTNYGFSIAWNPSTGPNGVTVTCRLTHAAGHFEETSISAPADNKGSKSAAQGVASTITVLQRYTALALLGIATADMPEPTGEAASDPAKVDTERNMKAVAYAKKCGRTKQDCEKQIGKAMPDWDAADLDKLRAWLKPETDYSKVGPPPMEDA
jgi:hypothetical protein